MLQSRFLATCLILVIVTGLILAGAAGVIAAANHTIYEAESGGQLSVAVGDTIEMVLNQQNGSTGYSWEIISNSNPAVLQSSGHVLYNSGIPGGVGTDTWTFVALKPGNSTLNMEYSRGGDIWRTFNYTVHVYAPAVPASSTWVIGLMTASIAAIMALAIVRRNSRV